MVDKMSALCLKLINGGGYIILDAYYASKNLIQKFRKSNLHLITRDGAIDAVGKQPLALLPLKRGRPRIWGEAVKLRNLFDDIDGFTTETLPLYGKMVKVKYRSIDLHWDCPKKL